MKTNNYFEQLWTLDWGVGIFFNPLKIFDSFFLANGFVDHPYFNFASPLTLDFSKLNLGQIDAEFKKTNRTPAIYLTQKHIESGFLEPLIRSGYKVKEYESWLGYDPHTFIKKEISSKIIQVTSDNYTDFSKLADMVFGNESTQKQYSQICLETLLGTKSHPGVTSEFFVIFNDQQPVATGAMFSSINQNFAYLHSGTTDERYRGKGLQTALIQYRIERAIAQGINRIYSITEPGKTSWTNFIKSGFNQLQILTLLTK